uniref:HDC08273 n=1 Tax=Drosophila melanogaster TaxID=7227 RepID=Q6ILV6_DROME|nr:TPA_inf: HDC08273 [Drosophila melanogaster]
MVWIWSLIALGIVVGATAPSSRTPETTTVSPYTALDKTITDDLQNILTTYERECIGNSEFTRNLDLIRIAQSV